MKATVIEWPIRLVVPSNLSIHEFFAAAELAYENLAPAGRQAWDREMHRLNKADAIVRTSSVGLG